MAYLEGKYVATGEKSKTDRARGKQNSDSEHIFLVPMQIEILLKM